MPGDIEALGDVATGAILATVVEPVPGASNESVSAVCLNCGAALTTSFCGQCGQKAKVHRTLAAFWHDLIHGVFHFDGKIWRTLPLLFFKPGYLTRRYVHGERAKFVSPLALFLFTVFLMFAAFNVIGGEGAQLNVPAQSLAKARSAIEGQIAEGEKALAAAQASGKPAGDLSELRRELAELRADLREVNNIKPEEFAQKGIGTNIHTGIDRLDRTVKHAAENPQLFFYKVQSSAYKFSWALILLSTPFVWLLFAWRREFKIFDHAVFVTYSICFMMLLFTAGALVGAYTILSVLVGFALTLWPPVHFYKQLKYAYGLGRFGAAWRTVLLSLFAIIVLTLFAVLILAIGATG